MNRRDLSIAALLTLLAAIFFAPVVLGGAVFIPFDSLYRFPPWSAFAAQFGVSTPRNELVLDLLVENYAWKEFIVQALRSRDIPLWNPYLFGGVPFLAAGQHSALYPFSILFYLIPVERAFGYFVALQMALAAITMFGFTRVLGLGRLPAVISAVVYAFSSFMVVSTTFPMVISAAAWLPAILACAELILRATDGGRRVLWAIVGALFVGIQFLAGHVEISIYILLVTAFYSLWRAASGLVSESSRGKPLRLRLNWPAAVAITGMAVVGIALGAVQLVPLYELLQNNFRSGSASYQDVIGWAFPSRQVLTFLMPDFFGNPTHHSYFDVFDFTNHAAPQGTIFWGIKNYVEAGAYVGILPLALALIAVITLLPGRSKWANYVKSNDLVEKSDGSFRAQTALFSTLGIISLLFTFGTPLYAVLFFGVPGFNQLHSPFRWVFPYTLSMAVLAGLGAQILVSGSQQHGHGSIYSGWVRLLSFLFGGLGLALLAILGFTWVLRAPILDLIDRVLRSTNVAGTVFQSGRMFYSYEFRNVLIFALFLIGAGAVLWAARRPLCLPARFGGLPVWKPLALFLLILDLFIFGSEFYPRANPELAQFTPPAIQFLQQDHSLYRVTSYDQRGGPEQKVFNPNVGMFYGISDIRGYDSIIPKRYAELMGLLAPQDELLNNRIAPFYDPDPFDSALLNLLNVKYVLTTRPLPNAGYTLVYSDEIQIYRNDRVLPRAFMVSRARVVENRDRLLAEVARLDPSQEVLLEQAPSGETGGEIRVSSCPLNPVSVDQYSINQVLISSNQACSGWLVLSDSYFPGWIAQVDDQDVPIYRADYNFRAVLVPAGTHSIRFKYSPISFRAGLIGSFLGAMSLLMGLGYVLWRRFYRVGAGSDVQVVAKNSLVPMATSLLMKVMDLALALFSLRILGPTGTGRYAWAVVVWSLANTITDFGLGILLTREVARDRSQANRYLSNTAILRVVLWALSFIPFGALAAIYVRFFEVRLDTAFALGLLLIGILPSSLSSSLAFLFNAFERFEYRVAIDVATRMVSITLSVIVLLLGYGYVGLAAVSIMTNFFTLSAFYYLVRSTLFIPRLEVDRALVRWMFFESYPLMLNNLLSSLFFRIDSLILQPLQGDTVLGYYSTAYKFIDALNFIPSNFTLAIFPALSRLAASAKDAMLRAYLLSLKFLLWLALPITVGTIFVARELIQITGGASYLPHSAIALQVLIWFLPFSFINSVTHYVLIALGQQRFLTKAFVIGVIFNVAANLAAIPPLGYVGAAIVTILSEIVLLLPFYYSVRQNLGSVPFWSLAWRPALASALMGLALWWMVPQAGLAAAIPLAGILYGVLLIALGALGEDERALLRRLLPVRWQRVVGLAE